jgi:hypothetical protein
MRMPLLLLLALVVISSSHIRAGQASGVPSVASEPELRDRVDRYWNARSGANLVAAYPFYEPDFRASYPLEKFLSSFQRLLRFRPEYQGLASVRFEPDGRSAQVQVRLRTRPEALGGEVLDSLSEETWRLVGGIWYRKAEALLPSDFEGATANRLRNQRDVH